MKRAWEQFALIIFGSMVGVFAFGVYYNMSLDTILLRTLIVGVVLVAIFSLVHTWLTMVFTGARRKAKPKVDGDSMPSKSSPPFGGSRGGVHAESPQSAEDAAEEDPSAVSRTESGS